MLSIVVPVYNEQHSLELLHRELCAVSVRHNYELDIVFVDDGSTDQSWEVISRLADQDRRVRGIRFRRNFGKAAGLSAGFAAARGEMVMSMDADLQDDPDEVPKLLQAMDEGYDVVSGWKQTRHDPWHKVWPSRVFNWLVSRMTGVMLHDHNCGFKCYRREVFHELRLYGELHRFVPVLAAARGWRIGEVAVHHRPREHGHSKYGLLRIPKGFLDLLTVKFLTGFGQRPQHLLGAVGLASFSLGSFGILILSALWAITRLNGNPLDDLHLTERAIFFYSLGAALLGAQFMSIGFMAELTTALHSRQTDTYCVAERAGGEASWQKRDESPGRTSSESTPVQSTTIQRHDASQPGPHIRLNKQGESSSIQNE